MVIDTTRAPGAPRHLWRSTGAILLGLLTTVLLSIGTDQVFHLLAVFPPAGQPMRDAGPVLLALAYRCIYAVTGGYITARCAPQHPMRHVAILGAIGLALGSLGAIVTIPMDLGPTWYPIALALTGFPCVWLGGLLDRPKQAKAQPMQHVGNA